MIVLFYIVCLFGFAQIGQAKEGKADANDLKAGGFNYKVIKPENQIGTTGYFDLRMTPGQKQTVQIELYNISDLEVVVGVSLNSAKTNPNGVLEYGPAKIANDKSLKYDFKDIVKGPKEVKLAPGATGVIDLEISMPEEQFDGYISGGIQLQRVQTEAEKKELKKTQGVINNYAFLVGMLLSETDTEVQPDLTFNKIYAGLTNYRNAIFVNFSNTKMGYMENMTVDMQVMKKGSDEVLYDTKKAEMRMAPNSMIDFPLNLNGELMEAGDYTGHILVTSGNQKWEWKEDFKITQEEADKYNGQDVTLVQERGINWLMIGGIVGGALLVLGAIYAAVHFTSKKKKKQKKSKNVKKSKKNK